MVQRPHGIEGVSGMAGARSDTSASRIEVGIGVAQAHANSALGRLCDHLDRAGQFGRDGQHANMSARSLPEAIKRRRRRRQQIFRRMHSAPALTDERTFKMNPQRPRPLTRWFASSEEPAAPFSAASIASASRSRAERVASSGAVTVVGK